MAYVRVQKRNGKTYYYLVESHREGTKVRQKVLKYMGTKQPSAAMIAKTLKEVMKGK